MSFIVIGLDTYRRYSKRNNKTALAPIGVTIKTIDATTTPITMVY